MLLSIQMLQPKSGFTTGDKLQFGLAAENAKAEGHKVEMVLVGDDCSLPGHGIAGRRGIAGVTLVTKVFSQVSASSSRCFFSSPHVFCFFFFFFIVASHTLMCVISA